MNIELTEGEVLGVARMIRSVTSDEMNNRICRLTDEQVVALAVRQPEVRANLLRVIALYMPRRVDYLLTG